MEKVAAGALRSDLTALAAADSAPPRVPSGKRGTWEAAPHQRTPALS